MSVRITAGETPEHVRAAIAPIWHYFGFAPTDEAVANFTELMTPQRTLLAREGDEVVGGCGSFAFRLTTPGGHVHAAGVSMVGVMPTHRRRGILRALMAQTVEDCRIRGEPVAYLWASEERIYGRYGFGLTGLSGDIQISRDRAAMLGPAPTGSCIRRVARDGALADVRGVYDRVASVTPGAFTRTDEWWRRKVLADPAWRRRGNGEMQCAILQGDDGPSAYALYRMNMHIERGISTGSVEVIEAVGVSPDATAAIWRFLLEMDWTSSITASFLPLDHPLILSVAEPRRLQFRQRDGAWARLVDVGAALAGRAYGPGDIVLEIADSECPWNAGRWLVHEGGAERTSRPADVHCDVASLACVYLGGFSWRQLVAAGRARAETKEAVVRADRVFETWGAPWCPEIF